MIIKLGEEIEEYTLRNKKDEDIPVYSVTNDKGFCTGYFSKDVSSKDQSTYKIVPYGCFAYNPSRINVGSVDWQHCEDKVIVSPLYVVFKVSNKINPQYLYYYLKSDIARTYIKATAAGSVRDNLKFSMLKEFPFNLRTLEEQSKIVKVLERVENNIELCKKRAEYLDTLVKSRFIEMFGSIVNSKYNYETCKLGEVAKVSSSHRVFTTEFVEKGIPFYRGTEIGELANGQQPSNPYYISEEHYERLTNDDTKPQIGDLLMPSICNKGQVWMVDTQEPFYYKDGRVLCISPDKSIFNSKFLQYFMREKTLIEYPKMGSGSTFAEFKIFLLKELDVLVPPREIQEQFADFVAQTDKSKLAVQKSLDELETLKKSLMQEYFG